VFIINTRHDKFVGRAGSAGCERFEVDWIRWKRNLNPETLKQGHEVARGETAIKVVGRAG